VFCYDGISGFRHRTFGAAGTGADQLCVCLVLCGEVFVVLCVAYVQVCVGCEVELWLWRLCPSGNEVYGRFGLGALRPVSTLACEYCGLVCTSAWRLFGSWVCGRGVVL